MTRRNGYVLEQLLSPLVVHSGPLHQELVALGEGCIIRHLYHHYRGFLKTQRGLLAKHEPTVKAMLYAYRVALTGIFVLRTGRIEAHLPTLLDALPQPGVGELVERKRGGAEKQPLRRGEAAAHSRRLDALELELAAAFEDSQLPDEVADIDALDAYVIRVSKELGGG